MSIQISIAPMSLVNTEEEGTVTVVVQFSDGTAYQYFDVPLFTALDLVQNPSGYNSTLRGDLNSEKIA